MDKITTGKIKKFFKGKGFAGALCLSIVAIGISTYLTYDSTLKTIADEARFYRIGRAGGQHAERYT